MSTVHCVGRERQAIKPNLLAMASLNRNMANSLSLPISSAVNASVSISTKIGPRTGSELRVIGKAKGSLNSRSTAGFSDVSVQYTMLPWYGQQRQVTLSGLPGPRVCCVCDQRASRHRPNEAELECIIFLFPAFVFEMMPFHTVSGQLRLRFAVGQTVRIPVGQTPISINVLHLHPVVQKSSQVSFIRKFDAVLKESVEAISIHEGMSARSHSNICYYRLKSCNYFTFPEACRIILFSRRDLQMALASSMLSR